jgi:bloom syndrome protein
MKAAVGAKGKATAPYDCPQSTNVSSPIQQAARRRAAKAYPGQNTDANRPGNGYGDDGFVVPADAPEHGQPFDDEQSDDGFDPVRVAGRPRRPAKPPLGPPITMDEKMDRLNGIHRLVVEDFVVHANREGENIRNDRGLRAQPFTDTIYREMAINFPRGPLLQSLFVLCTLNRQWN